MFLFSLENFSPEMHEIEFKSRSLDTVFIAQHTLTKVFRNAQNKTFRRKGIQPIYGKQSSFSHGYHG